MLCVRRRRNDPLKFVGDIDARFAVEQSSLSCGQLMELAIVVILVLGLVLAFLLVMK